MSLAVYRNDVCIGMEHVVNDVCTHCKDIDFDMGVGCADPESMSFDVYIDMGVCRDDSALIGASGT